MFPAESFERIKKMKKPLEAHSKKFFSRDTAGCLIRIYFCGKDGVFPFDVEDKSFVLNSQILFLHIHPAPDIPGRQIQRSNRSLPKA
jgi:hypothetical protein